MTVLRNRKVLLALAAIATLFLADLTGLDAGLIDQLLDAIVDALAPLAEPDAPVEHPSHG